MRRSGEIAKCGLSSACCLLLTLFLSPCLFKEKERELCVRERLAEDKLARAESLLKNYSLLKEQKFLRLASGPGMRISSVDRSCLPPPPPMKEWPQYYRPGALAALAIDSLPF